MALFLPLLLAPFACGPDAKPPAPCDGPDFEVLITSAHGDVPSDIRVVLVYGSGREEFVLGESRTPEVLFCSATDGSGQPAGLSGGGGGNGGNGGDATAGAGAGGGGGAHGSGVATLHCTLWTQGPATLRVTASGYLELEEELELERGTCTVEQRLELMREQDAG